MEWSRHLGSGLRVHVCVFFVGVCVCGGGCGGCRGRIVEALGLHACRVGEVNNVRLGRVVAGSVLAAGPTDAWHKVAPVPVDEPVLAGVHAGAGGRVGASHDQAVTLLHETVRVGVQPGGGGGAGPSMVVGAVAGCRGRSRVCRRSRCRRRRRRRSRRRRSFVRWRAAAGKCRHRASASCTCRRPGPPVRRTLLC